MNKKKQLIGLQTFSAASVNQGGKSQKIVHLCKSFHCYIIQVSKTELLQWFNKMLYWKRAAIGEEVQLVNIHCVTMRCYSVVCVCVCIQTGKQKISSFSLKFGNFLQPLESYLYDVWLLQTPLDMYTVSTHGNHPISEPRIIRIPKYISHVWYVSTWCLYLI